MVMSFPFIAVVERNERQKKEAVNNLLPVDRNMICLSNLDEIVFYPCSRKEIFSALRPNMNKPPVDYDKYLDFFE
tara:strand:+ start:1440 stop:1664 length:225 start_codon:yes stop_codon:yes gene_type:complete